MHQSNIENVIRLRFVDYYILSMTFSVFSKGFVTYSRKQIHYKNWRILINSERTKPLSFICLLPIVCALMLLAFFISAEESTVYSCKMSEFTRVPKQEADGRQWGLSAEVCSVQLIG